MILPESSYKGSIEHHFRNSAVYFTAGVQKSILTRDFVYMRARAIWADSDLARRQATVNL